MQKQTTSETLNPNNNSTTLSFPSRKARRALTLPCGRLMPGERIPGWARELGVRGWARLNQLLFDGWQITALRKEMGLPQSRHNSLQQYAEQRYSDRRIAAPVAAVREALASGMTKIMPDLLTAAKMIVDDAKDQSLKPEQRLNAANLVARLVEQVERMGRNAEMKELEQRKIEKTTVAAIDPREIVRQVYDILGIAVTVDQPKDGNGRVSLVAPLAGNVSGNGKDD